VIENILGKSSSNAQVQISRFFLDIDSKKLEKKFLIHTIKKFLSKLRMQYLIGAIVMLIFSVSQAVIERDIDQIFFVNFGITVCVMATFVITMTRAFEINVEQFAWLINFLVAVIAAFNSVVRNSDHSMLAVVVSVLTITNYCINFRMVITIIFLQFAWFCISYVTLYSRFEGYLWVSLGDSSIRSYAIVSLVSLVFFIKITSLVQRYSIEKLIKREFIAGSVLQSRSNLTTDLLKLLLPSFVLEQMKSYDITGENIGDDGLDAGEVTILFCDIADFDKVIKLQEDKIVRMLDSIFRRFDELCKENGVQKIETVGKTYMACGGLKSVEQNLPREILANGNPTARVLNLAKQMMTEIKNYEDLNLKIGIHRGKCMMGVIGYHKPQFSLIGDTVNFTSRHCTTGDKGHIMVSLEAWAFISQTNVKARGFSYVVVETEMKGKGVVPVYHVIPYQGLIRKRLLSIIDRNQTEGRNLTPELEKINNVLLNSKQELKRKLINSKINHLMNNVIERINNEMKIEIKMQVKDVIRNEVSSTVVRSKDRKKSINPQRAGKKAQTRLVQIREQKVEVEVEQVEDSESEEEDGEVAAGHPVRDAQAEPHARLQVEPVLPGQEVQGEAQRDEQELPPLLLAGRRPVLRDPDGAPHHHQKRRRLPGQLPADHLGVLFGPGEPEVRGSRL